MAEDTAQLYECPAVELDGRLWTCITSKWSAEGVFEERVPEGESAGTWSQMVTTVSIAAAQEWPLEAYAQSSRESIQARLVDGTLTWRTIQESPSDLLYDWTLEDDATAVDQLEVVHVLRGRSGLHAVHFAARGELRDLESPRDAWVARLRRASVTYLPLPSLPTPQPPLPRDQLHQVLDALEGKTPRVERLALIRRGLALTEMAVAPELWAWLHMMLGSELMQDPNENGAAYAAIGAYRNALEVLTRDSDTDSWASTLVGLGAAFAARAASPDRKESDVQHASRVLDLALGAFAEHSVESLTLWVEIGDAFRRVDGDTAREAYTTAYTELERGSYSRPADEGHDDKLVELTTRIWRGLARVDLHDEDPPEGSIEPDREGTAIFLRPLLSAGRLIIPNGFREHPRMASP
jgi:hypothetical protein